MQYNLAKHTSTQANTTVGNIPLTTHEIVSLADLSFASNPLATVSGSAILCIDCDLGTRVHLNSVDYHFATDQDTDAVASGIELEYKNEAFESYTTTTFTHHSGNRYTAGFTIDPFTPRYLRLTHTISGTTVTGTIIGFEVINDDTTIDFGADGSVGDYSVTTSLLSEDIISIIPVYNNGTTIADAYINLEPQSTDVDKLLTLSNSENGPWTGVRDGKEILGSNRWDYTTLENTDTSNIDGALRMPGISLGSTHYEDIATVVTTITTPPFYSYPAKYATAAFDIEEGAGKVTPDPLEEDTVIEVRHSNSEPLSYMYIRRLLGEEPNRLYYKDYWLHDSSEKYEYVGNLKDGLVDRTPKYQMTMDPLTTRWAVIARCGSYNYYWTYRWYIVTQDNETSGQYSKELYHEGGWNNQQSSITFENIYLDRFGGLWIYFYSAAINSGYWASTNGYHLAYFHRGMSEAFHLINERKTISDCDVVYDTGDLWYIDTSLRQVIKIDFNGDVKAQYATDDGEAVGITALDDGGCWFSLLGDLYCLDDLGNLVDTIVSPGVTKSINRLSLDITDNNNLWFSDGDYLVLYNMVNNTHELRVDVSSPKQMQPLRSGMFCYCSDDRNRYISKSTKRIEKEYYYGAGLIPGAREVQHDVDNVYYTNDLPIIIDTAWTELPWNKVDPRTYMLPDCKYHQFRVVLNGGTSYSNYGDIGDDTWDPDDDFEQSYNLPLESKWQYSGNVTVASGSLLLDAESSSVAPQIHSRDKWCVHRTSCKFTVDFEFPGGTWPVNQYIYMQLLGIDPLTNEYNGTYFYTLAYMHSNTRVYCYTYVNNGVDYNYNTYDYTEPNYLSAQGRLQIWTDATRCWSRFYNYDTGAYEAAPVRDGMANMLNDYFYMRLYTNYGGVNKNVHINYFTQDSGNIYVNKRSPVLSGLYLQDPTVINDIYPQQSKNLYMRTSMDNAANDSNGQYDSNINVWWDVPI
ncbi:hypothetical protein DRQ25_09030 [Candidatus Fermentibacteria bacterium]|nr:MAG: hypothetical protein DRQ25_09030 [Candidatus Fermentibacteria bacterium]